jgi:hypothetical protein
MRLHHLCWRALPSCDLCRSRWPLSVPFQPLSVPLLPLAVNLPACPSALAANACHGTAFGVLIVFFRAMAGLGDGFIQTAGLAYCIRTVPEDQIANVTGLIEGLRALGLLVGPVRSHILHPFHSLA